MGKIQETLQKIEEMEKTTKKFHRGELWVEGYLLALEDIKTFLLKKG